MPALRARPYRSRSPHGRHAVPLPQHRSVGGALAADRTGYSARTASAGFRTRRTQIAAVSGAQPGRRGAHAGARWPSAHGSRSHRAAAGRSASPGRAGPGSRHARACGVLQVDVLLRQHPAAGVPRLVLPERAGRGRAGRGGAAARPPQARSGLDPGRCASAGPWPVSARQDRVGGRFHVDHADALVAQHAAADRYLASAAGARNADEGAPGIPGNLSPGRPDGLDLNLRPRNASADNAHPARWVAPAT
ncbi:hypothetical protein XFF6990_200053 [Xanthomonas citri pv. fuscans]|nr:hypothetical protein XFF6990_200053 [Xanthomonas citri pv. fuscans]